MPYKDPTSPQARASARARSRRYGRSEQAVEGAKRRRNPEWNRAWMARSRAAEKSYLERLFWPSPDKRVPLAGVKRLVVLSDLQIPFEDPRAVDQALSVFDRVRPDTVILNGDIVDCYRESAFLQDWRLAVDVTEEQHRRARRLMAALQGVKRKVWLGGNHEERWWRIIKEMKARNLSDKAAPVVSNLLAYVQAQGVTINLNSPIQSFSQLFDMPKYGFTYYPYSHRLYVADQNLVITHGKYVSRHSGYTAKRTFEWLGRSCIVGHTHRLGAYLVTQDGRERGAWENGCLCQLEPEYDDAPNWQQGFSVVEISGPEFHVVQVPIVRKTPASKPVAVYGGR